VHNLKRWFGIAAALAALIAATLVTVNGPAQAVSQAVPVTADAWVSAYSPVTNLGSRHYFVARGLREAGLLSFNVAVPAGSRVQSATLVLNSGSAAGHGVSVYGTQGGWTETGVTWANAPVRGRLLATSGGYQAHTRVMWNVTAGVPAAGGQVDLRVENPTGAWMGFLTREADAAPPTLVITTEAPTVTAASLSGSTVPNTDLPGWKLSFSDDFTGNTLGAGWGKYNGPIPSMPGGVWNPSHVTVGGGELRLLGSKVNGQWTTGGVMNYVQARSTYGKYLVRFRMPKANGVKYAVLLWPASGRWPMDGEIDFAEDGGGQRASSSATVHWGASVASKVQVQRTVRTDFSNWHTVGVEWAPGKLVYTLDGGGEWGRVSNANIPSGPMNLAIQTEAGSCNLWMTCVDATTPSEVDLEVDWVAVYTHQ
jgi:hypothetical protein